MSLQLRFGTEEEVLRNIDNIIPAEPVVATDTEELFIGSDYGQYFRIAKKDDLPVPSNADPLMDGEATAGESADYSRADHKHPSDTTKANATDVATALDTKVDKVAGKGLSENDFTNELKDKLDGIEAGAQVNPLPSSSTPLMDNDASVGTSVDYARADHVHPKDTSKPSTEEVEAMIEALREELYYNTFESTSVSGEIVHIDDGAGDVPIKALTIGIEAQQDLHGQANPYPAGGGANKIGFTGGTFENGTSKNLVVSNGLVKMNVTGSVTSQYIITLSTMTNVALQSFNPVGKYYIKMFDFQTNAGITKADIVIGIKYNDDTTTGVLEGVSSNFSKPFIVDSIRVASSRQWSANEYVQFKLMVVSGETEPIAYAPYSNICPITGFTGANVFRGGKNIVSKESLTWTLGYYNDDGILVESTQTGHSSLVPVKSSTQYTLQFTPTGNSFRIAYFNSDKAFISRTDVKYPDNMPFAFTTPSTCKYISIQANTIAYNNASFSPCLVEGNDGTVYDGATTYPIAWTEQGTIYGGYVDVVRGKLTAEYISQTIDQNSTLSLGSSGTTTSLVRAVPTSNAADHSDGVLPSILSDFLPTKTSQNLWSSENVGCSTSTTGAYIWFRLPNVTTLNEARTYLTSNPLQVVYKLATPIEYDITPVTDIETLLGVNNIWADTGDIENLTYRISNLPQEQIQLLSLNRSTPSLDRQVTLDRQDLSEIRLDDGLERGSLGEVAWNDDAVILPIEEEPIEEEPSEEEPVDEEVEEEEVEDENIIE